MTKFFIVLLLIGQYPDGKPMYHHVVDLKLYELEECNRKAALMEEGAKAGLGGFEDAKAQCVAMASSNINRLVQSLN